MHQEVQDLRGFLRAVRRYWILVGLLACLGIVGGVLFTALHPPMLASKALVLFPAGGKSIPGEPHRSIEDQVVIASSDGVLLGALRNIEPAVSLEALRARVTASSVTPDILAIAAKGDSPAQAETTANAIAASYLSSVSNPGNPGGQLLDRATTATGTALPVRLVINGGLGALIGVLAGAIAAVAVFRNNKKLRERDEIADAVGIPVLASIPVSLPSDAGGWAKLLRAYEPGPVYAWQMRKLLYHLRLTTAKAGSGASLAVMSMSADRRALALGPQLAVFAASLGIPTTLVIGPMSDPKAHAALTAACASAGTYPSGLRVVTESQEEDGQDAAATALTIVMTTVGGSRATRAASIRRTTATLLGVSAGTATAEQLARAAVSAANDGHDIAGIVVTDPAPADHTTGRIPQSARTLQQRVPTRLTTGASPAAETQW
jgi:capsular polysaccharide biosynthesis protein